VKTAVITNLHLRGWTAERIKRGFVLFLTHVVGVCVCVCVHVEGDLNCIAGATSRNGAFIWDVRKGKIITRFNEVG